MLFFIFLREYLPSLPDNDAKILIEVLPAHKIKMLDWEVKVCEVLNTIRGSKGYAGRDPQGGTSDGSFVNKLSLKFLLF